MMKSVEHNLLYHKMIIKNSIIGENFMIYMFINIILGQIVIINSGH